jgi:nucleoside-diphosphate-sugar epimerase
MGSRILVAGGAGYIGSTLVPRLIERSYEVTVVDLLWFGNQLPAGVTVIERSIAQLTVDDLQGFDTVIFLGGLSNDPMAEYSPVENFIENGSLPVYLAYIAKRAGVRRFIHGGSCSVYGYTEDTLCDETSLAVSHYPYGISKMQGEFGCLQQADERFSVIGFRQGTVCGYSPRMRLDLVINTMFRTAMLDKRITVNNAAIWRPILAVQDAASAYIRAIETAPAISGIFNIASGNYTIGELADLVQHGVAKHMGVHARVVLRDDADLRSYKVDIGKARNILSFKPRYDVDDVVRDLAENHDRFKDYDRMEYYNIRTFKKLRTGEE